MAEEKTPDKAEDVEDKKSIEDILNDKQETDIPDEQGEEKSEEEFKGTFSQFKAKNSEEYLKQLEDAYRNSSTEGLRLNKELTEKEKEMEIVAKIVRGNPVLKKEFENTIYSQDYDEDSQVTASQIETIVQKAVNQALGSNPALREMEVNKTAKDKMVYDSFAQEHPEVENDPKISQELQEAFGALAQVQAAQGKEVNFEKTLKRAWRAINEEDEGELEGMKKVVLKEQGSSVNPSQKQSGTSPSGLTPAERKIAELMGMSDKDYLEGKELAKQQQ